MKRTCLVIALSLHAGIRKLQNIIRDGAFYIALGCDETDDPRPSITKVMSASSVSRLEKTLGSSCEAMIQKINNLLVKTVKASAIKAVQALVAFCPSSLQTAKMVSAAAAAAAIPLVDPSEWDRYLSLPKQDPAPTTTAGRVQWWLSRLTQFPNLAPIAVAYLVTPRSAAQAERTFSLLGHGIGCSASFSLVL